MRLCCTFRILENILVSDMPSFAEGHCPTYLSVCSWVSCFLCFTCSVCGWVAKLDSSRHILLGHGWSLFASWRNPCHCSQTKGGPLPSPARQLMLSAPCVYAASRHSTQRRPAQKLSVCPACPLCPLLRETGILLTWKGSNETWWNRSGLDNWFADSIIECTKCIIHISYIYIYNIYNIYIQYI